MDKGVYEPSNDSFLLMELIEIDGDERVLEIGCGSGIISIHCASEGCEVTAVDISEKAVKNTLRNAERNGLDIDVKVSHLFSSLSGKWDIIVFNPPYLPEIEELEHDPRWDGGKQGDEIIVEFLFKAGKSLSEEGKIYFVYSDRAPVERIHNLIERRYAVLDKISETFSFETIYAVELLFESE